MQALVESFTLLGIEAVPVEVQVSVDSGYPVTTIVGMPNKAVRESLDRILAAFHSSGFGIPDRKVTVNLAPAEMRKEGASFDLAIALGMQAALGCFPAHHLDGLPVAGELALNGEVRPIRGGLAMALAAQRLGRSSILLPWENLPEAQEVPGIRVLPLRSLADTISRLRDGGWDAEPPTPAEASVSRGSALIHQADGCDLAQIRGQSAAKRALEVAAAGGHNLLFIGPPGAGKTLLAQRLPTVLPPLSREESLEVTLIHSVAGTLLPGAGRIFARPFRAPHHTVTGPGLVGGGAIPKPGEVSLAHCGVLFLDELPEFRAAVLNLLRQPLEEGVVRLVRAGHTVCFPCRFMLVGAMNPCPCGFLGHPRKPCRCTPHQIRLYRNRIGGPLLDRIDLHIEVPAVTARDIMRGMGRGRVTVDPGTTGRAADEGTAANICTPSGAIRARVEAARDLQSRRFEKNPGIHCNAQMGIAELEESCRIDDSTRAFLQKAVESLSLSARSAHRTLRVARTIADLAACQEIRLEHVAEAVQYQAQSQVESRDQA